MVDVHDEQGRLTYSGPAIRDVSPPDEALVEVETPWTTRRTPTRAVDAALVEAERAIYGTASPKVAIAHVAAILSHSTSVAGPLHPRKERP